MTYVVTDKCVRCKYTDCVEVCPVDCFHEGEHMLVINPEECIDCGVCEPECPVGAIITDTKAIEDKSTEKFIAINAQFAKDWPTILDRKSPPDRAKEYENEENKFEKYVT